MSAWGGGWGPEHRAAHPSRQERFARHPFLGRLLRQRRGSDGAQPSTLDNGCEERSPSRSDDSVMRYCFPAAPGDFGFVIMSKSSVRNGVTGKPSTE